MTDEFTVEQIEAAISDRLKVGDMKTVVSLMHLLALKAPDHAQAIVDAIKISRIIQGKQ